jgi:CheY-like chemotaxis protein
MEYKELFWSLHFENNALPCMFFSKDLIILYSNNAAKTLWDIEDNKTSIDNCLPSKALENIHSMILGLTKDTLYFEISLSVQIVSATVSRCSEGFVLTCSIRQPVSYHHNRLLQMGRLTADMFHNVSNPLAVIQGRVELMMVRAVDEKIIRNLNIVFEQCHRITSLLDSVKTLSMRVFQISDIPLFSLLRTSIHKKGELVDLSGSRNVIIQSDKERVSVLFSLVIKLVTSNGTLRSIRVVERESTVDVFFDVTLSLQGLEAIYSFDPSKVGVAKDQNLGFLDHSLQILLLDCLVKLSVNNENSFVLQFPKQIEKQGYLVVQSVETTLTILLVDDNQVLRDTLLSLLSNDGHYIFTANSAEEAIKLLSPKLDVVLMDVQLPNMSGIELLEQMKVTHSSLAKKVILISGTNIEAPEGTKFLRKPFSKTQLNRAMLDLGLQ